MKSLDNYELGADRLKRFWAEYPDGRITTLNHTTLADRTVSTWVVEARIYLNAEEQERNLPKTTGWAFEVDGQGGMANKTSALENCESSAIFRALANFTYPGAKERPSREEMEKVARNVTPKPAKWEDATAELKTVEEARQLYVLAQKSKAPADVLDAIKAKVSTLG